MLMTVIFTLDRSFSLSHQIITVACGHLKCLHMSFLEKSLDNVSMGSGSRINLDVAD